MFMRITWGKTTDAGWIAALPADVVDLSRNSPAGLRHRLVAQDANDPENYYSITVFETLQDLEAWESSRAYAEDYLPRVERYLVGAASSSICTVGADGFDRRAGAPPA